jgi:hypothetical protein
LAVSLDRITRLSSVGLRNCGDAAQTVEEVKDEDDLVAFVFGLRYRRGDDNESLAIWMKIQPTHHEA